MAGLQLWCPLTKDARNLGLNGTLASSNNATYSSTGGKLGGCYTFNGSNQVMSFNCTIGNKLPFSIALWYKVIANTQYTPIFQFGSGASTGICVRGTHLERGDGSTNYDTSHTPLNYTVGVWQHLVVSYDGTNIYLYKNGGLTSDDKATITAPSAGLGSNSLFKLALFWAGYGNIAVNDLRLYSHSLSPSEVKEVSMGKVGHWLGNDWQVLRSGLSNAKWNLLCKESLSCGGLTITKSGTRYTVTATNFGLYNGIVLSDITPVEGHKYYLEINVISNSMKAFYFNSNPNSCGQGALVIPTNGTGLYKMVSTKSYMSGSLVWELLNVLAQTSGTIVFDLPKIIDLTVLYGSGNEPDADTFKKAFPLQYYPYQTVPSSGSDLRLPLPDISGLHNDLTPQGSPGLTGDTKRYDRAMVNNNGYSGSHLEGTTAFNRSGTEEITVSCWFKQTNRTEYQGLIGNRNNSLNWYLYTHTTDGSLLFHGSSLNKSSVIPALNQWHFVAARVKSNGKYDMYLDGLWVILDLSYSYGGTSSTHLCIFGFKYSSSATIYEAFKGTLSDCRVYATALSDSDITELYALGN